MERSVSSVDVVVEPHKSVLDLSAAQAGQVKRRLAAFEPATGIGTDQALLAAEFVQACARVGKED